MSKKKRRKRAADRSKRPARPEAHHPLPPRADGTPTLTVSMIARDETRFLPACLESIRGLADEVVVVDTGSNDDTIEIARRFGARVGHFEWVDDFAAARNASLAMARGDWVLSLDADEEIDAVDHVKLRKLIASDCADAFQMSTRNYCKRMTAPNFHPDDGSYPGRCRSEPGWVPSNKVRLWKNGLGMEWRRRVHELLEDSAFEVGARVFRTAVPIHHYGLVGQDGSKLDHYLALGMQAIEEDSSNSGAHLEVGLVLAQRGESEKALEHFAIAAELSPRPAKPLLQAAAVLLTELRFDEARERLETAIELEPDNPEVLHGFGVLEHFDARDHQKAISYLRRSLEISPDYALAHFNLARCHRALGHTDEAMAEIRRAADLAPRHIPVLELHAAIALEKGRPEDALSVIDTSIEVDSANWKTHNNRGIALSRLQRFDDAEAAFRRAESLEPEAEEVRRNLAELARKRGGESAPEGCRGADRAGVSLCMIVKNEEENLGRCLESAREAFDQIVVVDTGSTDRTVEIAGEYGAEVHHFEWCDDFAAARNRSLSFAKCEWIMWLDADDVLHADSVAELRELPRSGIPPAGLHITLLMRHERLFHQQVTQLRILPNRPGIHFEGAIHEQVANSLEAAGVGTDYMPEIVVEHLGYADPIVAREKAVRNLAPLRAAAAAPSATFYEQYNLVQGCFGAGMAAEAEPPLRVLLDDSRCRGTRPDIWSHASVLSGRLRLQGGEAREALADFDRAAEADPESPLAAYFQAAAHKALGDHDRARAALQRAASEPGGVPSIATAVDRVRYQALLELAIGCTGEGDFIQAERLLEQAISISPAHPDAVLALVRVHIQRGRPQQAAELLRTTIGLAGALAELILPLGNLHFERGDLAAAEAVYSKVDRATPRISANLGKVLVLRGRDDEAIPHLESALNEDAALTDLHGVLGDAHLRRGRPEDALDCYENTLRSGLPPSATTMSKIGEAYRALGHRESAALAFRSALELDRSCARAKEALADLTSAATR
ncbi:MAG: hypothetical protein CME06_03230 [Gemmatimonadetes bacterium]|nr:hypothetical protein [Gemmatimonadota bacterium]